MLVDSLSCRSQVLSSEWTLCHQAFRELLHCWPATLMTACLPVYFALMADPQSVGTDAMMQSWDGLQVYAFHPFGLLHRVLSKVRQSRGLELTLVAPFWPQHPWFHRPSGASGGCSSVPLTAEGSTQTAALPSLSPEPPRASADCVSYIERSARAFGFTSLVARQLARCRRHSTEVNYQAKWSVFRTWCRRHGHSVSLPTIPKIASFLLYLCRSLSLSYSSIASYRSMLSGVFRFVLPDLSSHFVRRDLLRSFRLERPLSSSRVPPWDLSLSFFPFSGVLLSSPSLPALFGIFLVRCSSWLPWLRHVALASCRLSLW